LTPWSDKRSQDGCRDCGVFFLDVVGLFDRDRVQVRWSDSRRPTNEQIESVIEAAWAEQTRLAGEQGRRLYNGRLCRVINCQTQGPVLQLTLGEVSYKEFVGTNLTNAQLRHVHGPDVLANPLAGHRARLSSRRDITLKLARLAKIAPCPPAASVYLICRDVETWTSITPSGKSASRPDGIGVVNTLLTGGECGLSSGRLFQGDQP